MIEIVNIAPLDMHAQHILKGSNPIKRILNKRVASLLGVFVDFELNQRIERECSAGQDILLGGAGG
ncbi:hypothetical protein SDC9_163856 [bioreactor metagenome]|uniref:Uncharacterized protein n=1 Tax=bioreactor metagenome TaxID=1076179 RepID=A0A645FSA8_9ZZZZ